MASSCWRPFPSLLALWFILWGMSSCSPDQDPSDMSGGTYSLEIPPGFPSMPVPAGNELTYERVALGRKLFFDPILSADSTVSCGSCHRPHLAFADDRVVSTGVADRPGFRNAPSLANIGYHPYFLREGGVPTLEQQVAVPVQEYHEFDTSFPEIIERLLTRPDYIEASQQAYGRDPDVFVVTRALGAFQRTLISGSSPWDRFYYQGDLLAVSREAIQGWQVFGEKGCTHCHSGFDFTDYSFQNIGLYLDYPDPGRWRLTGLDADIGRFKVPSLRNVDITAPYMHDGSLTSLDEVLDHFASGGQAHPNRSPQVVPITWMPGEREAIKAFLRSLTDDAFLTNPDFIDGNGL